MHSFKFDPPQQHRRSIQPPRNEHISLFNTLDKCTQILREDRLFLRGEIKNNNMDIIEIFKHHPKHSQFAQLQTKLRKHVQAMKNRIKNEQLSKFKESLRMKENSILAPPKPAAPVPQRKSHQKQTFKPHQSLQMTRNGPRAHRSVDHHQSPHQPSGGMGLNSSLRQFQHMLKYRFNQEVIEERDSENVTSTRQHRESEKAKPNPLEERHINSNFNQPRGSTGKGNYSSLVPSRAPHRTSNSSTGSSQHLSKPSPWQFEQKAKETMYHFKPTLDIEIDPVPVHPKSKTFEAQPEDREESIFDQCLEESQQIPPEMVTVHQEASQLAASLEPSLPSDSNFMLKQSAFEQPSSVPVSGGNTSRESRQQNLFTPQELLAQCRNFLKYRESSMKKSGVLQSMEGTQQMESQVIERAPLQESVFPKENHKVEEIECMREGQGVQERENEVKKEEESCYVYPSIKESSSKKQEDSGSKLDNNYMYTHFETFANQTSKQPFALPTVAPTYQSKPLRPTLPRDFSVQAFVEELLQVTEMNPFITIGDLREYIQGEPFRLALEEVFQKHLAVASEEEVCITALAETVDREYSSTHGDYPHEDKAINSVYDLLDIDQKGFISKEDIQSFLGQIEEAEIDNFEEVSQELWKLFDGADFTNEQRLTYWHFFVVKNSDEFGRVGELLGQFQFEIERDN